MIASAGVRHKAEKPKRPASINLALGVLLETEIATTVAAAGSVMRASPPATPEAAGMQSTLAPPPRPFRTRAGEKIGPMSNNQIDELTTEAFVYEPLPNPNTLTFPPPKTPRRPVRR